MSKGRQIFPECEGDTTMVEILGFNKPDHQPNISQVLDVLNDAKNFSKTLVGIIDDDKKKPTSFLEFNKLEEAANLLKLKHPDRNHFLIVLKPALEKFLFAAASQAKVEPARFGFGDENYFKKVCKSKQVASNQNFKQFINTIKQKKEDSCLKTLQTWLLELLGEEF